MRKYFEQHVILCYILRINNFLYKHSIIFKRYNIINIITLIKLNYSMVRHCYSCFEKYKLFYIYINYNIMLF